LKKYYYEISIVIEVKAENIMIAEETIKSDRRSMLDSYTRHAVRTPSHKRKVGGQYTQPFYSETNPVSKVIRRIPSPNKENNDD
jgi:hypothetical protein